MGVAKNKEIIKTKSVGELAHIGTLSDFPIPDNVENLYNKLTATSTKRPAPAAPTERPSSPQSFKETIYDTLPRSMRETQLITNSKFEEDEERLKERQELTRTKSPTELSQISSMSDFPIPTPVENLLKKKSEQTEMASPPVPARKKEKKEGIYDSGRMEEDEIPPPLPPKRITPSPKKGLSLETQPSLEEEEEAVPVKGILSLQAVDGNIRVVRNEIQNSQGEQPQAPRREKQSQPREMTEKATP